MANSLNTPITTTYAGEFAGKYIAAALLSGDTLDKGGVTIKPNVKFKEVIKKLDTGAIVKDATCDFIQTDNVVTLTERILQPEEFNVNLELCKKDFRSDWEAVEMGFSAYDNLPPAFADFLIAHVSEKVSQNIENQLWSGTGAADGILGFSALLNADGGVVKTTTTATSITAANVIEELGKVVDDIPNPVKYKDDLHLYVSNHVFAQYVRALGGFGAAGVGAAGVGTAGPNQDLGQALLFDGIKIFRAPGLATNDIVAAEKSNLFFGTGLLSDKNEVRVLDMGDLDGSQNVRIIMRFTYGIQYGIPGDIVYYTI
mgnify:FL=1|tara:strand:- start:100 stop:1041 length:942 start_codon:yes stop_codon:yes gene_type:complete